MQKMNQTFTLTTLAATLLTHFGPAAAAEDAEKAAAAPVTAVSSEQLQSLPSSDLLELVRPSSWVSIGGGYLGGDDRRQLGIVGGIRDTAVICFWMLTSTCETKRPVPGQICGSATWHDEPGSQRGIPETG